jgi:hypothetical protein
VRVCVWGGGGGRRQQGAQKGGGGEEGGQQVLAVGVPQGRGSTSEVLSGCAGARRGSHAQCTCPRAAHAPLLRCSALNPQGRPLMDAPPRPAPPWCTWSS